MPYQEALWSHQGERFVVEEVEHLFGFDIIVSHVDPISQAARPRMIITNQREMSRNERFLAQRLVKALDRNDYAQINMAGEALHLEG